MSSANKLFYYYYYYGLARDFLLPTPCLRDLEKPATHAMRSSRIAAALTTATATAVTGGLNPGASSHPVNLVLLHRLHNLHLVFQLTYKSPSSAS